MTSATAQSAILVLYDSISLVCGNGLGKTFCGTRTVTFYDATTNLNMGTLLTYYAATEIITV